MLNSRPVTSICPDMLSLVSSWNTSHRSHENVVLPYILLLVVLERVRLEWERVRLESNASHVMRVDTTPRIVLQKLAVPRPRATLGEMDCQPSHCHAVSVITHTGWRKARIKESLKLVWLPVRNSGRCQLMREHRPWLMPEAV